MVLMKIEIILVRTLSVILFALLCFVA